MWMQQCFIYWSWECPHSILANDWRFWYIPYEACLLSFAQYAWWSSLLWHMACIKPLIPCACFVLMMTWKRRDASWWMVMYHAHTSFALLCACVGTNGYSSTRTQHELTQRAQGESSIHPSTCFYNTLASALTLQSSQKDNFSRWNLSLLRILQTWAWKLWMTPHVLHVQYRTFVPLE